MFLLQRVFRVRQPLGGGASSGFFSVDRGGKGVARLADLETSYLSLNKSDSQPETSGTGRSHIRNTSIIFACRVSNKLNALAI